MDHVGDIRLVLLGKKGVGKSSVGNSLLGSKVFKSTPLKPECRRGSTTLTDQTKLVVVDTPGIADTNSSTTETFEELAGCIDLLQPGPHAFLFVLNIDRFTKEEMNTIKHLKYWFGRDVMKYAVFIVTGKDSLDYDGLTITQYIENSPPELKTIIEECDGRVTAINNRGPDPDLKIDVKAILTLVKETMQANNGQYYSQQMYSQAVKAREGQPSLVEDEKFNDVKDLRIREALKRHRQDQEDQTNTKKKKSECSCNLLS